MRSQTLLACLLITAMPTLASAGTSDAADAAQRKDIAALRTMVSKRVDVNAAQADGTTALHWAAHWNDVEAVKLLLGAGAKAATTNRFGSSPLSEAAISGNADLVKVLLDAGADAKALSTPDGETVLMSAARSGNLESVRMLLDRGADVNARERYKGQTALMWAAAERHAPVVKLLLERGADWKVRGFDRETKPPKLSAASAISPIPRGGFTALMFTAREGDLESARIMLDAGVDINHGDVDNVTPLVAAIMNKQYALAKFLIDRGADVSIVDAGGRTALYAMIDIRNEDWTAMPNRTTDDPLPTMEVVKAIIDHGAKLDVPLTRPLTVRSGMDFGDNTLGDGATPMMRAARAGDHEVIRLLLAKGANPALATKNGVNALMLAAGIGYRDKNTRGLERDALETVKVMMATGLDLKQTDTRGENALHGAALRGADTIVQFLVDQGMDVNATSKQGYTPLDVAMGKTIVLQLPVPQESTVALLKKLGGKEGPGPGSARPPVAQRGGGQKVAEARPGDLRVMVTAAIRTPLEAVRIEAQKAVGKPLVIEYGSARGNLKEQILAGQPFEVAMLLPDVDEDLAKQGKIRPGSVVIARVPVAIGQRGDAPKIDMSTPAALKAAMLKAKSLRWSPTGAALLTVNKILDTLDIRDAVKSRHNLPGTVALDPGEYELNIYPLSEILENKAVTNLGPVIPELQAPAVITAVVSSNTPGADAARAFIKFLQGPALDPALKGSGMTR